MTQKSKLGQEGENFAADYLKNRGYKVIEKNKREKWGELDIITMAPDKTLVFIEVKTMVAGGEGYLKPEDQMSGAKIKKFRRTAELYANSYKNQKFINDKKGWRLDLIALEKQNGGQFLVRHYENI
ncbi:MAG: YraN family protein [Minisyncoccia bacterium]